MIWSVKLKIDCADDALSLDIGLLAVDYAIGHRLYEIQGLLAVKFWKDDAHQYVAAT